MVALSFCPVNVLYIFFRYFWPLILWPSRLRKSQLCSYSPLKFRQKYLEKKKKRRSRNCKLRLIYWSEKSIRNQVLFRKNQSEGSRRCSRNDVTCRLASFTFDAKRSCNYWLSVSLTFATDIVTRCKRFLANAEEIRHTPLLSRVAAGYWNSVLTRFHWVHQLSERLRETASRNQSCSCHFIFWR